jgi:secondary thiamine-phosphate synthase enzyme
MKTLQVRTNAKTEFIDITRKVQQAVSDSGMDVGFCMVYVPHTTAAVTINENADPSVQRDILDEINKVIPFQDNYDHAEGNSAAHIKSSLFGCSAMVPVEGGKLQLGTWQGIYFCEFDGGRNRKVQVTCK